MYLTQFFRPTFKSSFVIDELISGKPEKQKLFPAHLLLVSHEHTAIAVNYHIVINQACLWYVIVIEWNM